MSIVTKIPGQKNPTSAELRYRGGKKVVEVEAAEVAQTARTSKRVVRKVRELHGTYA